MPEYAHEKRLLNGRTQIVVIDTDFDRTYYGRIIEAKIPDLAKEFEVEYVISNRRDDAATIQADIERKQRINEAYSQGATNILANNYQDNCDANNAATIPIYIDDDVRYVNTCELTFETKPFRSYSQATEGGGYFQKSSEVQSKSTQSGGSYVQGSTVQSKSTSNGGGTSTTSGASGNWYDTALRIYTDGVIDDGGDHHHGATLNMDWFSHNHTVSYPSHNHDFSVTIPGFSIPDHSHEFEVTIPAIEIDAHTHDIKHGIYELGTTPSNVQIRVDGNLVNFSGTSGDRIDLIDYLDRDTNGKVTRGRHEITLHPNNLARIEADVISRVFIQSDLGGKN